MIDHYDWPGGREALLRFGPDSGPVVMVAPALFEEANRTRTLTVQLLRALAERGVAGALPDLPGQNESLVDTLDARLADWRTAFAAAVDSLRGRHDVTVAATVRGGALLDGDAHVAGRWQFAPVDGAALVRDLERTRLAPSAAAEPSDDAVLLAGNRLSPALLDALRAATPTPGARVIRLAGGNTAADLVLDGPPLWRRSEPESDAVLAARLADDLAAWVTTCAAS